jgi:hypothetical protein
MRQIQKLLLHESDFDYDPPRPISAPKAIADYTTVVSILRDSTSYTIPWSTRVQSLLHCDHTFSNIEGGAEKVQSMVRTAVFDPRDSKKHFAHFLDLATTNNVRDKCHKMISAYEIDITNVSSHSWTQFVAALFHIPIGDVTNNKSNSDGLQLYAAMTSIFQSINRDEDPVKYFKKNTDAKKAVEYLAKEVLDVCEALKCSSFAHILLHQNGRTSDDGLMPDHGDELLQRLFDGGLTVTQLVPVVLAVNIAVVGSHAVSQRSK